ncbi:HNH endonuclease signature motif containing protein [uncultured Phocaeicola sp.]|uniref:HNH endonuclease signature motif containing protein n=1 Tax=uncultured Phocaeicola sp. TaxID=990718 RepID=UPI0025DF3832|nr:HNH endonuclease signature motif containing protein [uncultured Phocaeicola sp.]
MKNDYQDTFEDLQADFYHYMVTYGGITPKTSSDYVTRLKFLAATYDINSSLTEEHIQSILEQEETNRQNRNVYSSRKSISDFRSGLRKFLKFIQSDYHKLLQETIREKEKAIISSKKLTDTEKQTIISARIGQGYFRNNLIKYWHGCAVSGCTKISLLVASHIKPWCESTNEERLDTFNGLLLLPNYDKLFDSGYITFDLTGSMVCSKLLSENDKKILGLDKKLSLVDINEKHLKYLKFHKDSCFLG